MASGKGMGGGRAEWAEVERVRKENRRELVLSGESVSSRIAEHGLDEHIFSLINLNFLEISKAGLSTLPDPVSKLQHLTNLGLNSNSLKELPSSLGELKKLKFLDVSFNQLQSLPVELGNLKELQTLNVNNNSIETFIDISGMVQLHSLDVSHNQLVELPSGITDVELALLATVIAHHNQIALLPAELGNLATLKYLDVSDNAVVDVPAALCECGKLKDFKCGGNKLKDKRLAKMLGSCTTKSVLDYLKNIHDKEQSAAGKKSGSGATSGGAASKDKKKKGKGGKSEEASKPDHTVKVQHFAGDEGLTVKVTPSATTARPYIVCCIVRNLNFFKSRNMMKRFLALQTRLHDGLCAKRQAATIATHDLESVKGPLTYDARPPQQMTLVPLNKRREVTAAALVGRLRQEAEILRKESKRNTVSGIHKYLELLKDKSAYPCLLDVNDVIISFPPITNCDATKVMSTTRHILIEVTSSTSLDTCKKVMDELLLQLLLMGIGQAEEPARVVINLDPVNPASLDHSEETLAAKDKEENEEQEDGEDEDEVGAGESCQSGNVLVVEQVKVIDSTGGLRIVYPSRVDLKSDVFSVERDYE